MNYNRNIFITSCFLLFGCNTQYDLDDYLSEPAVVIFGNVLDNEKSKIYIYNTNTKMDGQSLGNIQRLTNILIDSGFVVKDGIRYNLTKQVNSFSRQVEYYNIVNFVPKPLDSLDLYVFYKDKILFSSTKLPETLEIIGSKGFEIKRDDNRSTVTYSIDIKDYLNTKYIIIENILFLSGELKGQILDTQRKVTRGGSESVSIELDFNRNYNVDSAVVTVYNLSEKYFDYLTKVEDVKSGYSSIFSSSMVDLPTNVQNGFGFFTGISKTKVTVRK